MATLHLFTRALAATALLVSVAVAASAPAAAMHRPVHASVVTFVVDTTNDTHDFDINDGLCADSAQRCSLRAAIEQAAQVPPLSAVTIDIPAGQYNLTLGTLEFNGQRSFDIEGDAGAVVSGNGQVTLANIFYDSTVTLGGLTLSNGATSGSGGGIVNDGNLTLRGTTLSNNTAHNGAGIYNLATLAVTQGSSISDNTATGNGGGIDNAPSAVSVTVDSSSLLRNQAAGGAGVYNNGVLTLTNASVDQNVATANGGGVDCVTTTTTCTVRGGDITGNHAVSGAGIYSIGSLSLTTTKVEQNVATGNGGGVDCDATSVLCTLNGGDVDGNDAVNGAGVYGATAVTATNVSVDSNVATGNGGGLDCDTAAGDCTLSGGDASSNQAVNGAGVYTTTALNLTNVSVSLNTANLGNGAGVDCATTATVCTMSGANLNTNSGTQPGVGIYNAGTVAATNTAVNGNTGTLTGDGAGIYNLNSVTFQGGTISSNVSVLAAGIDNFGTLQLTNTQVNSNHSSSSQGVGGVMNNAGAEFDGVATQIDANRADSSADGGGINNAGTVDLQGGSHVDGNVASNFGGGVYNTGTFTMGGGGSISGNAGNGAGGGALYNAGSMLLDGVTLDKNKSGYGGAGYNIGSLTIHGGEANSNNASDAGGAFYNLYPGVLTLDDGCLLNGNTTTNDEGAGIANGSASSEGGPGGQLEAHCTFTNDWSSGNGGAIYSRTLPGSSLQINLDDSIFANNIAFHGNGGALYFAADAGDNTTVSLTDTNFDFDQCSSGGHVYSDAGVSLTVDDSTFTDGRANASGAEGGAIFSAGTLDIQNTTFVTNRASAGNGGAIYMTGPSHVVNSTFAGNGATNGGAVWTNSDVNSLIAFSTFSANQASGVAAAVDSGNGLSMGADIVGVNGPDGSANCSGTLTDVGWNLDARSSCGFGATSIINQNPLLGTLANNGGPTQTFLPADGSPVIEWVPLDPSGCAGGEDQRHYTRPGHPDAQFCDIGAVETDYSDLRRVVVRALSMNAELRELIRPGVGAMF